MPGSPGTWRWRACPSSRGCPVGLQVKETTVVSSCGLVLWLRPRAYRVSVYSIRAPVNVAVSKPAVLAAHVPELRALRAHVEPAMLAPPRDAVDAELDSSSNRC